MSQAELAQGLATAPYISLIERGRKIPSAALQRQLLARLGVDLQADASDRSLLAKVCAAFEVRDASGARELIATAPTRENFSAHRELAHALTDFLSGFYADALPSFIALFNEFAPGSVEQLWTVRGACGCAVRTGKGDIAPTLARQVLSATASPNNAETDHLRATIRGSCATLLSLRGDYSDALEMCREGLRVANSPWASASALWAQAMTYERMGNSELAAMSARDALSHAQLANRPHDHAALSHLAAWLEMRTGDFNPADIEQRLSTAEVLLQQMPGTDELAKVKATRAELVAHTQGIATAVPLFEEALAMMSPAQHVQKGRELIVMGTLLANNGQTEQGISALHRALNELSQTDNHVESARAWHQLGLAYETVGLVGAALDCMKKSTEHLGLKNPTTERSTPPTSASRT